jgi:hypothetical protein
MSRKNLSDGERRALTLLVAKLFDGVVVSIPVDVGITKQLCFRMAGEELPELPEGESLAASENSLFVSGEVFSGGKLLKRTWLGMGPLDEVLITLDSLGGSRRILKAFLHEASVRRALGVKEDDSFDRKMELVAELYGPKNIADIEFQGYEFGDGCQVEDHDGWVVEHSSVNETTTYSKAVYVRFDSQKAEEPSIKATFNVVFRRGQLEDVYALEHRHGTEIGQPRWPASERPRG